MVERRDKAEVNRWFVNHISVELLLQFGVQNLYQLVRVVHRPVGRVSGGLDFDVDEHFSSKEIEHLIQSRQVDIFYLRVELEELLLLEVLQGIFEVFSLDEMVSGLLQRQIEDKDSILIFLTFDWRHLALKSAVDNHQLVVSGEPYLYIIG